MLYTKLIELLNDAENRIDSERNDIEMRCKELTRYETTAEELDPDFRENLINEFKDMNGESALSCMYAKSLLDELAESIDKLRLLEEFVNGAINNPTFNRRYEQKVLEIE